MANQALGAPNCRGRNLLPIKNLRLKPGCQRPLAKTGSSQVADRIFHLAMLACALCVLALVGVIIYELASKSSLSWHAFGWKFFFRSEWDPVNDQYGACRLSTAP